jgi:hypothetical protein
MESMKETSRPGVLLALVLLVGSIGANAQRVRSELHIEVRDPQGQRWLPMPSCSARPISSVAPSLSDRTDIMLRRMTFGPKCLCAFL